MGDHVFVSYSRTDLTYVDRLVYHLQDQGLRPWIDKTIDYGSRWERVIREKVDTCAAFVVVMTLAAEESDWVAREIDEAQEEDRPIRPLLLSGKRFFRLAELQFEDVRSGGMPSARFAEDLKTLAGVPASLSRASAPSTSSSDTPLWEQPYTPQLASSDRI